MERRKILTKELKKSAGNYGSPTKWQKKITKLPIDKEDPRYPGDRKYKKKTKKILKQRQQLGHCPFCYKDLNDGKLLWKLSKEERANECKNCGAIRSECPSCHKESWENKEGVFHHEWMGCGFSAKKSIKGVNTNNEN